MAVINPPIAVQARVDHDASDFRSAMAAGMMGQGVGLTPIPKSGIIPGWGKELSVAQRAAPGMGVLVGSGEAELAAPITGHGGWYLVNDADLDVPVTASHATLARTDLIIARVGDAQYYTGGDGIASIKVITGTAGGGVPAVPVADGAWIKLAQIAVAAASTQVLNAAITLNTNVTRPYTVAAGGILPVATAAIRTALTPWAGLQVFQMDTKQAWVYDGSIWTYPGLETVQTAFRNVIRNGDMGVAQRGSGPFTAAGSYTVDGFQTYGAGGTLSTTRFPLSVGNNASSSKWYLAATCAGQAVSGDYCQLSAKMESVQTLAGQVVTLSFLAGMGTGTSKIGIEVTQNFGTGGSPSATVNTTVAAIPILVSAASATLGKYSVTFTVPTVAGKVLGTSGDDFLSVGFWTSAGATYAARASSIGIQNVGLNLTDVQLEAGPFATPFERLPQQVQLAWCQRYYWQYTSLTGGTSTGIGNGIATGTTTGIVVVRYPTTLRAVPSYNSTPFAGWATMFGAGSIGNLTGMAAYAADNSSISLSLAFAAAAWGAGGVLILQSNSIGATIAVGAEL